MSDLVGVVLAAGAGTRLRPLTTVLPKALCPVANVPLVDLAIGRVAPHVGEIAVNAHAHAELLGAHVRDRAHVSVEEPIALGTAGALGALRPWIAGRPVLVTNADAYLAGALGGVDDAADGAADNAADNAADGAVDALAPLVAGWDGRSVRLLVTRDATRGDFGADRYAGSCLLPWDVVAALEPEPTGLYEVVWRALWQRGELQLVRTDRAFVDCGTPSDYLAANLHASGGASVVGEDAVVEGSIERCVVWPGARVERDERLVEVIRAPGLTVTAPQA